MSAKLIFKMELFKFFKNTKALLTILVLSLVNIGLFLGLAYMDHTTAVFPLFGLISLVSFMGTLFFIFIYPYELISADYQNNVMALMIASGVNRTKLFFSKIGATFIISYFISLVVMVLPLCILLSALSHSNQITLGNLTSILTNQLDINGMDTFLSFLNTTLNYFATLLFASIASMLVKGRRLGIFFLFLYCIVVSLIRSSVFSSLSMTATSDTQIQLTSLIFNIILSGILTFCAIQLIKRQNL